MNPPHAVAPVHPDGWTVALSWVVLAALLSAAAGLAAWWRRRAARAWRAYADEVKGEVILAGPTSPRCLSAQLSGLPVFMETAVAHDDPAPYAHTRATAPIVNPGCVIFGLRRRSMLEEARLRRSGEGDPAAAGLDPDFVRRFIIVGNDSSAIPALLAPEFQQEITRYGDIEVYVRSRTAEWRRAGTVDDLPSIRRLNEHLAALAQRIDALPSREIGLTRLMADEDLIARGV